MKVIRGLRRLEVRPSGSVVTIGVFDGVHIGHRRVISRAVDRARRLRAESVVITFDPHPSKVLSPGYHAPSLISLKHRIRLIGELGADTIVILKFTKALSGLSPEKFARKVLVDAARAREVHVSRNFYFGRAARAGVKELDGLGRKFGFVVRVASPATAAGVAASSSMIRALIRSGKIGAASRFLGRPVSMLGTVVAGARLARELGYPTANINPHHEVIPPSGVYAVMVRFRGGLYGGVLNIGLRPTFYAPRDREPAIEVHIFGFKGRIYGRDLEVFFVKKLREEIKFGSVTGLTGQIRKDAAAARSAIRRFRRRGKKYIDKVDSL
jgi:riboflavin kinase/FMN adenylyltransferase